MSTQKELQNLGSSISKLREQLTVESSNASAKLERLQALYAKRDYWQSEVNNTESLPGIRQPHWYVVDIPFESQFKDVDIDQDISVNSNEVIISADNGFVCTQIQTYYLSLDDNSSHYDPGTPAPNNNGFGRLIPTSVFNPYSNNLKVVGLAPIFYFGRFFTPYNGQGNAYPEFEFQIEIEGSGRFWSSPKLPAHALYGVNTPVYLGMQGVVENQDKIKIYAYPTQPVRLDGKVRFVLHGYHIGSDITLRNRSYYI
jgi:hypothetical protein